MNAMWICYAPDSEKILQSVHGLAIEVLREVGHREYLLSRGRLLVRVL
jgi:hypothetical protein